MVKIVVLKDGEKKVLTIKPHSDDKIWVKFDGTRERVQLYQIDTVREMFKRYTIKGIMTSLI